VLAALPWPVGAVRAAGAVVATVAFVERVLRVRTAASTASVSASATSPAMPKSTRGARPVGRRARQFGQKPETGVVRKPQLAHRTICDVLESEVAMTAGVHSLC